jgi:hypothetical protein
MGQSAARPRRATARQAGTPQPRGRAHWSTLSDDELLDLQFRELGLPDDPRRLRAAGTLGLVRALSRLDRELAGRGIGFRPHYWFAEEWFSPDGVPGIAIPFYLAHPRLARLERRMMGEVEGGNARWLMRILRHEAGHAVDTAWRLRTTTAWRRTFGPPSRRYPRSYVPRPRSQAFVLHLGHWYAQSHPTEDFAETFAVWLAPRSRWRSEYADWPVAQKLRYVDETMAGLRGQPPLVTNRRVVDAIGTSRRTLREHYRERRRYAEQAAPQRYDRALRRCFVPRTGDPREIPAASFIQAARPGLTRLLSRRERLHPYLIHNVARLLVHRARELDLAWRSGLRQTKRETLWLLERMLFDQLRRGRDRYLL